MSNEEQQNTLSAPQVQEPAQENAPVTEMQPAEKTLPPAELLPNDDLKKIIETLLFITDRPVKPTRLAEVIENTDSRQVRAVIQELRDEYIAQGRAVQIVEIAGGFQMSTKAEYGRWVRRLYNEKMTTKLSAAALETLAIIAYKQPITRAEMEAIRGVDVAGPLERLLERSLVRVVGKKDTIGRPMVYGTTDEFLRMFGLNKVSELPDLQVFVAKNLHEKQEDLPFDEPLPPLAEPAIIPLDELPTDERLEAVGTSVDSFFQRGSYKQQQEDLFVHGVSSTAPVQTVAEAAAQQEETAPQQAPQPAEEKISNEEEQKQ